MSSATTTKPARKTTAKVAIVIAWTEQDTRLIQERRTDLGERPIVETVTVAKAAMWLNAGTAEDVAKAEVYAKSDTDKNMRVYTFPPTNKDPLASARKAALAGR